ncbi:MAG: stage 0 sporulation protein [Selenomonadaceae bacterium]|nr:stage 0 sporulation protein [Selenomonadaceae bacterium]
MQTVIGVRFKKAGKIYYFSPGRLDIAKGDDVIVETARGVEYGRTVIGPREVEDDTVVLPLKIVQRKASEADKERVLENKEREKEAFGICGRKIAEHQLPMKLVDVEYTFDMNKIVFYFTADGRIDFRELVKDLAYVFRTRIELRQIGVRDEAKLMGGIGCCGRPLCCASFLGDFEPVSIRMAKEQNLSLNPTKISGICGRLLCCLKYENDCYEEACHKKPVVQEPKQGSRVVSVEGAGKVISVNTQRRTATILLDDGKTIVASWEDVVEKEEEEDGAENVSRSAEKKGTDRRAREDGKPHNGGEESSHRRSGRGERSGAKGRKERGHKESKDGKEHRESRDQRKGRKEKREGKEGNESARESHNRRSRSRRPKNQKEHRNEGNTGINTNNHGGYGKPFADVGKEKSSE